MASVFLSYDHEDSRRAAAIATAPSAQGHSVWWDREIHGGAEYNSAIETAMGTADAVVVLWSANSVRSAWVRDEAAEGRDRGRLVPVLIEAVKPPMGFRQYQTIDLSGWSGGKRIASLPQLLDAIQKIAGTPTAIVPIVPPVRRAPKARPDSNFTGGISRRLLIGAGTTGVLALIGGGYWWATTDQLDPRVQTAIDNADAALRNETADQRTVRTLEQATSIQRNSARAWGWLALVSSMTTQHADPVQAQTMVEKARSAAARALAINPKEPSALLAMFELQGSTLDWFTRDQRLREIIAIDPKNWLAIAELVLLTQATGFCSESWGWNERGVALDPLNPKLLGRRALKLWILGRIAEADKVIDQVRALYPTNEWARYVRLLIYTFTDRAAAALALLDGGSESDNSALTSLFRASLPALVQPSGHGIAKAREACIEAAERSPELANAAVELACGLNDADTAFAIAEEVLLARGPLVLGSRTGLAGATQSAGWRLSTQWMFTPPASILYRDRRFLPLCAGIGLTDYWRSRGRKPDFMLAQK